MPRIAAVLHLMLVGVPLASAAEGAVVMKTRFEVWLGGSLANPGLDTTYETLYSPTFGFGPVDATAGQALTVRLDVSGSRLLLSLVFSR